MLVNHYTVLVTDQSKICFFNFLTQMKHLLLIPVGKFQLKTASDGDWIYMFSSWTLVDQLVDLLFQGGWSI